MKFKHLLFFTVTVITVFIFTDARAGDSSKDMSSPHAMHAQLYASNAWVQAMPPSETTTAAYMVITNQGPKGSILKSVSCELAGATELHQMSDKNGMMHMAMVHEIEIPAHGKVDFQQDGYHIMLINLKKPVKIGDIVPITLHFQDGSSMRVNAQVKEQDEGHSSMPGMRM